MENLQYLIEEQNSIKNKITSALKTLKQWFLDKIDQIKEVFSTIKNKVIEKLRSFQKKSVLTKNIYDINNNKILSKGDSSEKVQAEAKILLNQIKRDSDDTLKDCRDGVKSVSDNDTAKAAEKKSTVVKKLGGIRATILIIVGLFAVNTMITNKSDKNNQDLDKFNKNAEDKIKSDRDNYKKKQDDIKDRDKKEYDSMTSRMNDKREGAAAAESNRQSEAQKAQYKKENDTRDERDKAFKTSKNNNIADLFDYYDN